MQKLTEQHRHKISMAMKGRNLSEGHKAKLRVAMKGINTWTKGSKASEETKKPTKINDEEIRISIPQEKVDKFRRLYASSDNCGIMSLWDRI